MQSLVMIAVWSTLEKRVERWEHERKKCTISKDKEPTKTENVYNNDHWIGSNDAKILCKVSRWPQRKWKEASFIVHARGKCYSKQE